MSRLKALYKDTVRLQLKEELNAPNIMAVPRVTKITLNMGVGEALGDKKQLENAVADMTAIAGQKPVVTLARRLVARSLCVVSKCGNSSTVW